MELAERKIALPCSCYGRTAAMIVSGVEKLGSSVYMQKKNRTVNMKSLVGVLSLGAEAGDVVWISCLNPDKETAERDLNEIAILFTKVND